MVLVTICIKTSIVHFRSVKLESNCYLNSIDSSPICIGRYAKLSFLSISFVTCIDTDNVAMKLKQCSGVSVVSTSGPETVTVISRSFKSSFL